MYHRMNKLFTGKKLLVLAGHATSSCEIVEYAKSQGAYVIVTDYLEPMYSPAKQLADESWMISTADVDLLEKRAREYDIDGIFTGTNDFHIERAIELCERLNLPFYCNREQWEICNNKQHFKQLCRNHDVPVIPEYNLTHEFLRGDLDKIQYPVILKPVDSGGSKGISVCYDENELIDAYNKALSYSTSKHVIVERYMSGTEAVLYCTIQDGYVSLSAMCDRYTNREQNGLAPLPTAYIFPSRYLSTYLKLDHKNVQKMYQSIGLKNGFIFLQAFIDNDRLCCYEMGCRIAGAQGHKIVSAVNDINALQMLVNYQLTGIMSGWDVRVADNPKFPKMACKLTPLLKTGKIGRIIGLDKIEKLPGVKEIVPVHKEGDIIDKEGTLEQILVRIFLTADSKYSLATVIDQIQNTLQVTDENGQNMLLNGFDTRTLTENDYY
jgi:biotin carboxylase